jgi:hypothetical protein
MPSVSRVQQRYMGVQLAKKRAGKATDVDMSEAELVKMASNPPKGKPLPEQAKKKR